MAVHSAAYLAINILSSAVACVIFPLFTLVLSPAEYGTAGVYLAIIAAVASCLEYGLLVRRTYIQNANPSRLSEEICACVTLYFIATAILSASAFLLWNSISRGIPISRLWLMAALFTGFFQACLSLTFALWQISQFVRTYCSFKILFMLLNVLIALIGLFGFSLGWEALAWASLVPTLLTLSAAAWDAAHRYNLNWRLNVKTIAVTAKSIFALIPYRLSITVFAYAGPILVATYVNIAQSGLYILAFQICTVIGLGYESIISAIIPHVVVSEANPTSLKPVAKTKIMIVCIALVCCMSLFIALLAPPLIRLIFPAAYDGAIPYILWLSLARCFHGINRMAQEIIFFYTPGFSTISIFSLVVSLLYTGITVILLKVFGGIGGCIGLAAGHGLWLGATLVIGVILRTKFVGASAVSL